MKWLFVLCLLPSLVFAQDSDRDLNTYIQMFGLKGLPAVTPKNEALYQLGFRLYYDNQLSGKDNISCHACHSLGGFSGDTLPLGVGEGAEGLGSKRQQSQGVILARHTPALWNMGLPGVTTFFWDGRVTLHAQKGWLTPEPRLNGPTPALKDIAATLDSLLAVQAIFPIANPSEMLGQGSTATNIEAWTQVMERLFTGRLGASYKRFFREAYPGVTEFNIGHVGNALAELQRHHFLANNTPWDQYVKGNSKFMTKRMKRGAVLFYEKASCVNCHAGDHMTSFGFQNIGIPQIGPGASKGDDKGRMEWTQSPGHMYTFRVAPLRNIALTAPYMHTGVFGSMWEVIDHYDNPMANLQNFVWNEKNTRYREDLILDKNQDHITDRTRTLSFKLSRALELTPDEKTDLYCFLMVGLTDLKNQADLLTKGVLDEIDDCSPRLTN